MMEQFKGLWRDTWWLWLGFVASVLAISILDNPAFLAVLPILPGVFIYFAMNRYDKAGRDIGDAEPEEDSTYRP